jgi:predicted N-acyltransferase
MADCLPLYIILSLDDTPAARATFWLVREEPLPVSPLAQSLLQPLLRRWPLLICRSPLSNASGLILPEPPLRRPALDTIISSAHEEARKLKASFLIFDFLDQEQSLWDDWPARFVKFQVPDPGTCMEIRWQSFDEYLNQLSKNERKHYKRTRKETERMGLNVTRQFSVSDVETAEALARNIERRYNSAPNPWLRGMFDNLGMVNGTWLTAAIGNRLVGSELVLHDGNAQIHAALGLEKDIPFTYLALGYEGIRLAIEKKMRLLRWGSGAYDLKRRLGFQIENNNTVLFTTRMPLIQKLGQWISAQ